MLLNPTSSSSSFSSGQTELISSQQRAADKSSDLTFPHFLPKCCSTKLFGKKAIFLLFIIPRSHLYLTLSNSVYLLVRLPWCDIGGRWFRFPSKAEIIFLTQQPACKAMLVQNYNQLSNQIEGRATGVAEKCDEYLRERENVVKMFKYSLVWANFLISLNLRRNGDIFLTAAAALTQTPNRPLHISFTFSRIISEKISAKNTSFKRMQLSI